ncbi:hypothetical protein BJ878DRAFT_91763 [Calycina marina]|uniref:Proteophosphoglycan 5 n=1 Tax=Calycina marina TaxID=1763456 RepID=A0A9P7ZBM4_9HELO|nr:hypothetical protein BJ878DRAFT_91763 [Calycina marina]
MSTVLPPSQGGRSVTAPASTSAQQHRSHALRPRNQNSNRNHQAHATNSSDIESHNEAPDTPPRTPRRQEQKSNENIPDTASKQKSRGKKPKNVNTSPAMTRNGRNISPSNNTTVPLSDAKPISTPTTAAFAGPTFHASPAPSALPIPSFFSKSVPESPGTKSIKEATPSPPSDAPLTRTQAQREESPLDIFFKADREEKARARSATSVANEPIGPFPPPAGSPQESYIPPSTGSFHPVRPRPAQRNSSSGMFAMELDGAKSPGEAYGPAFSTPYSERMNAARLSPRANQSPSQGRHTPNSEALKAYLFSGQPAPSPDGHSPNPSQKAYSSQGVPINLGLDRDIITPGNQKNPAAAAARAQYNSMGRSSGLRQEVHPTGTPPKPCQQPNTYASPPSPYRRYDNTRTQSLTTRPTITSPYGVSSQTGSQDSHIRGMEDSLRRILNLGPASPGNTGSNVKC